MGAALTKIGLELQINHGTAAAPTHGVGGGQTAPDVAALTDGDFIVAFQSISELGDQDIYAQQITAAGTYDDVQRDVAAFTPDQTNPSVAPTAGGGYITAWEGFSHSIQLDFFNAATGTFSTPLTIRDTSGNPASYSYPTIATFANGNYVLNYQSQLGSAPSLEIGVVNPGATPSKDALRSRPPVPRLLAASSLDACKPAWKRRLISSCAPVVNSDHFLPASDMPLGISANQ